MENLKRFFINGEWVDPISDQTMLVINPATEEQIGTVALGNASDVDVAVEAASAALSVTCSRESVRITPSSVRPRSRPSPATRLYAKRVPGSVLTPESA